MSDQIIVIRAGGTGTRLWPLSTSEIPKQFVSVLSEKTLIQETVDRVRSFGFDRIFITTNKRHVSVVQEQIPEVLADHIIAEPLKRNTGPGIAYETATLRRQFPNSNPIIISIPSDDYVKNPHEFLHDLELIIAHISQHPEEIILPLVTPVAVDPGYTYVQSDLSKQNLAPITSWVEKPDVTLCERMVAEGVWFAHAGMYMWRLDTAEHMFKTYAPLVWDCVNRVCDAVQDGDMDGATVIAQELPVVSIESLATKVYPHRTGFRADAWGWSDVGKWMVVKALLGEDENHNSALHTGVYFEDARNNLVYTESQKRVVVAGISDVTIVDMGDRLLVCSNAEAQRVGALVDKLERL